MNNKIVKIIVFILFFSLSIPLYGQKAVVSIKEKVVVPGPVVVLNEIAEIICQDEDFKNKLEKIEIANSPPPLKARIMKRDYILSRLKQNQIPIEEITLSGNGEVIFSIGI